MQKLTLNVDNINFVKDLLTLKNDPARSRLSQITTAEIITQFFHFYSNEFDPVKQFVNVSSSGAPIQCKMQKGGKWSICARYFQKQIFKT